MDYEKKYKEALEKAKEFYALCEKCGAKGTVDFLEDSFPELKESEDEKIRESLLRWLKSNSYTSIGGIQINDVIAWLEKQGEKSSDKIVEKARTEKQRVLLTETDGSANIDWDCRSLDDVKLLLEYGLDYIKKLEKQGKQKPSVVDFKAEDWYVSEVDGKIYNAKYMEKTPTNQVSEKQSKPYGQRKECFGCQFNYAGECKGSCTMKRSEQKPVIEMKSAEESLGVSSEVYNDIVNECVYGEQKPADKVEPKFHEGEWITCEELNTALIVNIDNDRYEVEFIDGNKGFPHIDYIDRLFHLWTIQDAKDGDVLTCDINKAEIGGDVEKLPNITPTICIYQNVVKDKDYIHSYSSLYDGSSLVLQNTMYYNYFVHNIHPATKEQHDTLFAKMKEAGYEWDTEKKELKKIEQKPTNENPTDVGHEYYSDLLSNDDSDNIDDYAYQCAYCMSHDWMKESATWEDVQYAVKLGAEWQKQKSAEWSEEDERTYRGLDNLIYSTPYCNSRNKLSDFLKSLKDRVQPKQEWSEEDEHRAEDTIYFLDTAKKHYASTVELDACIDWLKSLKQRIGE